ncbi:MAG TPA: glutamate racemase [Bacillota bacterium]|nr:glutamate racemase [Bacillota bacterium]HQE02645.1 glutamate racemase [Bacillota bacterium]
MLAREKAIGLLDSGVGGLTLVKELNRLLPGENIVYFGDTARMPYGPRPPHEVRDFAVEIIEFLAATQDLKLFIVACNTATAVGLAHYQALFPFPILGVLEPGARAALKVSKSRRIGVIGTEGTIASKAYPQALTALDPEVKVFDKACPLFVLLVENQLVDTPEADKVARSYLRPLQEQGIDTLILGCTHYPLMEHVLARVMGDQVALVNSATATALSARDILAQSDLLNPGQRGWQRFFVSGDPQNFAEIGSKLLGYPLRAYRVVF